jgi:hypothetical protein
MPRVTGVTFVACVARTGQRGLTGKRVAARRGRPAAAQRGLSPATRRGLPAVLARYGRPGAISSRTSEHADLSSPSPDAAP